jgi:hypothetical protein
MPKIRVPVRREKDKKIKVSAYVAGELQKRVRNTADLSPNDHKKYKIDTVANYNRSVNRITSEGQLTISQLMGTGGKKSDSDSDFEVNATRKRLKKGPKTTVVDVKEVASTPVGKSPLQHSDSASSIDSVYVTGVKMPKWGHENEDKKPATPPSNSFPPPKSNNQTGVYKGTRKKKRASHKNKFEALLDVGGGSKPSKKVEERPCEPRKLAFPQTFPYPGIQRIEANFDLNDPQPGDLVMATAGDIYHPAVANHSIDPSYLLLGVVSGHTYVKWVTEEGQEVWENFANNHERVVVTWTVIDSLLTGQRFIDVNYGPCNRDRRNNTTCDVISEIPPTHKDKLKILCKRNSCKLGGLNEFLCEWIVSDFTYDIVMGWQHKN